MQGCNVNFIHSISVIAYTNFKMALASLVDAVKFDDWTEVHKEYEALDDGTDFNTKFEGGMTLLHYLAETRRDNWHA